MDPLLERQRTAQTKVAQATKASSLAYNSTPTLSFLRSPHTVIPGYQHVWSIFQSQVMCRSLDEGGLQLILLRWHRMAFKAVYVTCSVLDSDQKLAQERRQKQVLQLRQESEATIFKSSLNNLH